DVESAYRGASEISADYARDPVLCTARWLIENGALTAEDVLERYEAKRALVIGAAHEIAELPHLGSAAEVMKPLTEMMCDIASTPQPGPTATLAATVAVAPLTLAQAVNRALLEVLERYPQAVLFGEDVARKGGVYGVTRGLLDSVGPARVFDTVLDEQAILGLAAGAGISGLLPIAEIQYLAYLHNAADQIRGEAATLQFFSNRQYRNPMVVRIAAYGYQKGFGGHFHNDNAVAALRDIPGIVIASPSRPDDAAAMMLACADAAVRHGAVCIFLEPIALYHSKDLYEDGDGEWMSSYPTEPVEVGHARVYGEGNDLTIVTFGNGVRMSLRCARELERVDIGVRVVDIRWIAPLPIADIEHHARATGRVLVVDETRSTGGVGEGVIAALADAGFDGIVRRVASKDSFIPLGDAALEVLLSEDSIIDASGRILDGVDEGGEQ
ncbi:MAG: transketolase C-terminal domain-containing protein, partial [Rhodococcus sp. (in: high G+C Gram-positive bacteria)]